MRKALFFAMATCFAISLALLLLKCSSSEHESDPITSQQTTTTVIATTLQTPSLPIYVPGSIKLEPADQNHGLFVMFSFLPTKRYIYYGIPGEILDLGDVNASSEVFDRIQMPGKEPQEMAIFAYVKYCNISKVDFNNAIEKRKNFLLELSRDLANEEYELPNADIIYTFDNEIINHYYRRE